MTVELRLPWPPSVNALHRHILVGRKPRTLLSQRGREFLDAAASMVAYQREGRQFRGRCAMSITLCPPTARAYDIDNRCKALLDACTHGGVWLDDGQVDVLLVQRGQITRGGMAIVTIEELTDEQ